MYERVIVSLSVSLLECVRARAVCALAYTDRESNNNTQKRKKVRKMGSAGFELTDADKHVA